jgi:hypothetical protein
MRWSHGRKLYLIAFCLVFAGGFLGGYLVCIFHSGETTKILRDNVVIAWVGVGVNLAVVFVALFINVLREHLRKPRFIITCGREPPFCKVKSGTGSNEKFLFLRLRIENSGLSATEDCEVRLEKIGVVKGNKVYCSLIHDPRPLKWIGRKCDTIQLSPGAFDFVDLGVQNEDHRENFCIRFPNRGQLDLNLIEDEAEAYILRGNVYGKGAFPQEFAFRITWDVDSESLAVMISEEK